MKTRQSNYPTMSATAYNELRTLHIKWLLEGTDEWNARRERSTIIPILEGVNIYEEHRKVGRLDANGRVNLCGINLDAASLSRATLTDAVDFTGASFIFADLQDANLIGVCLEKAEFKSAKLQGARLDGAKLHGAVLDHAKLGEANLSRADLREASFFLSELNGACFSEARLNGADLSNSFRPGADLSGSRPWEAKLYSAKQDASQCIERAAFGCRTVFSRRKP